eukprot:gene41473-51265_t
MTFLDGATRVTRAALLGATMLCGFSGQAAFAQSTPVPPLSGAPASTPAATQGTVPGDNAAAQSATLAADQPDSTVAQDIVVTGYRNSLALSTNAKRASTGFTDSIFAEDIGKFPDTNIAESFNRISGITITRDITGEGTNVAIRGLGSNFTNVTLNGAPIA